MIFRIFFVLKSSKSNVDGLFIFIWRMIVTLITCVFDGLIPFFAKNGARMQKCYSSFSIWVFFYRYWQLTRQNRMGGDHLCPSITFTQDIYLKFGIWDDYRLQLIAVHVNTRLLLECWFRFTYWFYVKFY